MKKRNNKNLSSNRFLIRKLKLEGRAKDNNIEKILSFKKPKALTVNPKLINNKNNKEEEKKNRAYNEALNMINQFNKNYKNNIINYIEKKDENTNFLKGYKKCKKKNGKTKEMEEIDQRTYVFGQLLKLYDEKGLKIPGEFFYNDIYKESGLLLVKRSKMDEYFEDEIKKNGESRKGIKSIQFLKKLSDGIEKVYRKRILEKNKIKPNKSMSDMSRENLDRDNTQKNRAKMTKKDYFNFFQRVNANLNDIKKQEKEIQKLKELISREEEENNLLFKSNNNNNFDNVNSNIYIESYNNFSNIKKIKETKTDETANNSNSFNNLELYTSSTAAPKNNSVLNSKTRNKLLLDNNSNLINSSSFNEINNIIIENNTDNKDNLNEIQNNNSIGNIDPETVNLRLSLEQKRVKRASMIKFKTMNKTKLIPPISLNKIIDRRKSFLPTFFAHLNTSENIYSMKSDKMLSKIHLKNIPMKKNNSQPNIIKKPIKEIYEKVARFHFHPFKKLKNNESIDDILKKFYGDKFNELRNNDPKEILKKFSSMKGNILNNESQNYIYSKYKEILPNIMKNKIRKNNEQNEQLKEHPLNYLKSFYYKKYIEFIDKND